MTRVRWVLRSRASLRSMALVVRPMKPIAMGTSRLRGTRWREGVPTEQRARLRHAVDQPVRDTKGDLCRSPCLYKCLQQKTLLQNHCFAADEAISSTPLGRKVHTESFAG